MAVKVMGVDPGFANLGYSILEIGDLTTERLVDLVPMQVKGRVVTAGVMITKPAGKKRRLHSSDDRTQRLELLRARLEELMLEHTPLVVGMEDFTCLRSAADSAKIALAWACTWTLAKSHGIVPIYYSAQDVKRGVGLGGTASKADVISRVGQMYPGAAALTNEGREQHAADAVAVAYCAAADERVVLALRMATSRRA